MTERQAQSSELLAQRFARRFCPDLILQAYFDERSRGLFDGAALVVDISGFTRLTETFAQDGDRGAEHLAGIVKSLFDPLIDCVYHHDGFVSHFAGDGFVAIFPGVDKQGDDKQKGLFLEHAITAAWEMRDALRSRSSFDTPIGRHEIAIKFGISSGPIRWQIVSAGDTVRKGFHFAGEPLLQSARAQARADANELILAPGIEPGGELWRSASFFVDKDGFTVLRDAPILRAPAPVPPERPLLDEIAPFFLPHPAIHGRLKDEFRNTVSVFLGISPDYGREDLEGIFATLLELQQRYEGFLKDICFDEKGCYGIFFWGAPVALERDSERALGFLSEVFDRRGNGIRAGVTSGMAHSGLIGSTWRQEYSCHGSKVNLAARMMAAAPWGEIWCDDTVSENASRQFAFAPLGEQEFKGFSDPLPALKLAGRNFAAREQQARANLFDRDGEINQLRKAVGPVFDGAFAGVSAIYGEPGIGKTTLVQAVRETWAEEVGNGGLSWLTCPADETWAQSLAPFRRCLETYFEIPPGAKEDERRVCFEWGLSAVLSQTADERLREELQRTESFLAAILEIFSPNSLYEQVGQTLRQENSFLALKCFFHAESKRQPLVLELEDLQWFDSESMDFLTYLGNDSEQFPLAMIATCRHDDQGRHYEMGLDPGVPFTLVELDYLSHKSVRGVAQHLLGGEISDSLHEFLLEKSSGNPLYLEQLVLALDERDMIERVRHGLLDRFELAGFAEDQVPASIALIVISRLDRLPMTVKETVQMGSVLGQEVDVRLLGRMLRSDQRAERDAAYAKGQKIWIEESALRFRFIHALLRDSAYGMQLLSRRLRLHRLAAAAVKALYSPETPGFYATLAYHYECGGNSSKAIACLEKAAKDASQKYQIPAAIGFIERLLEQPLSRSRRIEALANLAEHLNTACLWERSGEVTAKVLEMLGPQDRSRRRTEMLINLGDVYRLRDMHDEARAHLDEAIALCHEAEDRALLAKAYAIKAGSHKYRGELHEALHLYERSSTIGEAIADRTVLAESFAGQGSVYGLLGEFVKARDLDLRAIAIYEELGRKSELLVPMVNVGLEHYYMGDHQDAIDVFGRTARLCEEIGDRVSLWLSHHFIGCVEAAEGKAEQAISHFNSALRVRAEFSSDGIPYHTRPFLAEAHYERGNYLQSAQAILDHLDDVERAKADRAYGYAYMVVARLLIQQRTLFGPAGGRNDEAGKNERKALNDLLRTIGLRSGFPPDPLRFFAFAMEQAMEGGSLALLELVRILRHFGGYLCTKGRDPQRGALYLRVSRDIARQRAMKGELDKTDALAEELGIAIAVSGNPPTLDDVKRSLP